MKFYCNRTHTFLFSVIAILFLTSHFSSAQTPILDEQGNNTGLINMNPDPLGEPWIAGTLPEETPEEIAAFNNLPEFQVPPELLNRSLPKTVDNSITPQFTPVFNQIGSSCGQASGIGYHFSYERNLALGTLPTEKKNICAYGFTWNFINKGTGGGSLPSSGYTIAQAMGCAHVPDFNNAVNGGSQTAWMNGYAGYFNANDCHVTEIIKFDTVDYEEMKQWFYDKGTGTGKDGGCITFGSSVSFTITEVSSGPFEGQKLCTELLDGSAHCMTLAGYTDEISYDVNEDGIITNDIDITRDGVVDTRDRESGAILLVNSWGTSWNNKGKVWVLAGGLGCHRITSITVAEYSPKLLVKAKITSETRNTIVAVTGYSSETNASTPTGTKSYGKAFNEAGGEHPMCGKGESPSIEIGLDCTEFLSNLNAGKGTIFLQISGTGTVDEMSVMYHPTSKLDVFDETKYSETNVTISGTMNLGVSVDLGPTNIHTAQHNTLKSPAFTLQKTGACYYITVPQAQDGVIYITNMLGKIVQSVKMDKSTTKYQIGQSVTNGTYLVTVASGSFVSREKVVLLK